ncbi:MAG TPA: APC family permease [Pyrinomonadaceae bacterium]|nr:APC family permease [Pyrinomonadaceae bacterium]
MNLLRPDAGVLAAAPWGRRAQLLRVLGVTFGLAVTVGNTIGAGILRTPGEVAAQLPSVWLLMGAWVVGALYALLGANSVAELGTMMPCSGGQYVFARRALGPYAGFVVGWSDWVSTCGSAAAVAIVIGEYTGVLVPVLAPHAMALAAGVVLAFAGLQWRGIHWGSGAQNLTSLVKALAFVAFIAACVAWGGGGALAGGATPAATAGASLLLAVTVALQAVIYTYDGWTGVIYFSEEVRDPARDIPRSLFGGVLVVAAIYLLFNLALLYVLPVGRLAGEPLAAGAAAAALFGERGDTLIRALTVVSLLSAVNALLLIATRVPFAMSRDRLFPAWAVRVNRGGTPTVALLFSLAATLLFLTGGGFNQVIAVLAFFFVANYAVSFTAVFVLRRREPEAPRPFRAWGYPWTTALALLGSLAFMAGAVATDTRNSLYALALLALSYPAYLLVKRRAGDAGENTGRRNDE